MRVDVGQVNFVDLCYSCGTLARSAQRLEAASHDTNKSATTAPLRWRTAGIFGLRAAFGPERHSNGQQGARPGRPEPNSNVHWAQNKEYE